MHCIRVVSNHKKRERERDRKEAPMQREKYRYVC